MSCEEMRDKLTPYVDSELSAEEVAEFESHLRSCAACAADALGMLQMKQATRVAAARYAPSSEFRLRIEERIRSKQRSAWHGGWFPRFAIAAVTALLLLAAVTIWASRFERERGFVELTDMHISDLASANPVDIVSTDRHTVKPWFAGRIPFTFNLPEMQNSGFTLDGGRVVYFHHSPGAQLLFHIRKHEISVFIFQEHSLGATFSTGSTAESRLAFHMETWSEGGLRYFLVSDAPASDVHALSEILRNAARS